MLHDDLARELLRLAGAAHALRTGEWKAHACRARRIENELIGAAIDDAGGARVFDLKAAGRRRSLSGFGLDLGEGHALALERETLLEVVSHVEACFLQH